jgi:hypothetical protein
VKGDFLLFLPFQKHATSHQADTSRKQEPVFMESYYNIRRKQNSTESFYLVGLRVIMFVFLMLSLKTTAINIY